MTIYSTPSEFCRVHDACAKGARFACRFDTMEQVWDACDDPQWLLWILHKIEHHYDRRKMAAKFVREVWHLLEDDRSKTAVEAIEQDTLTDEIKSAAAAACAAGAADAAARAAHAAYAAYAAYTAGASMRVKQATIIKASIANPFK